LAPMVVWEAVANLFPNVLAVEDLMNLLDQVGDEYASGLRQGTLRKYGYPPDRQEKATQTVLRTSRGSRNQRSGPAARAGA